MEDGGNIYVSRSVPLSEQNVMNCCRLSKQRGNHTNCMFADCVSNRTMCWNYYVIILSWRDTMFVKILHLVCVWQPDKVWLKSYVYWTVHHLDSWVKRDQLDVTCFIISLFIAQHVSDVNTTILRSLRLICWVISCFVLIWFDVCWFYVVVWLWWCGIRMQVE